MARTIRRKHVPTSVTEEWEFEYTDPETGITLYGGYRKLKGKELAARLRWWHEDKSTFWGARPPKYYRQKHEERHRAVARNVLIRWAKNPDYPVQILRKPKLGYWD
ncbi:hypothetical protein WJ96_04185 [Burkholderia ubonensis]|uniref:Uncharacterized protein n=1 Tax=Burkholderia ubonensis TaxID=101571 RepID=A0AAW3MQD4_9BURK|nr:hypothetical protein [Burkholderia ubonensis]KVP65573.1 hypothetical protein WJ93_23930 [Burkholderia ubonensis]KVP97774.1 hypothetical protein WJ96_04185 [Burkholderia ubonensis]KVZ92471.1 hypothetical protein WL25_15840 [Burkholderia ubonensis]